MEKLIREFTHSVIATQYLMPMNNQDEPIDLSMKKGKILVTSSQLDILKIKAESSMPCIEKLAHETITPMVEGHIPKQTLEHLNNIPMFNNSWNMMKSLLLMPQQLESRQQVFNSMNSGARLPVEYDDVDVVYEKAVEIINVTDVQAEENSDKENITPKTSNPKRRRSSVDKPFKPNKRVKLNEIVMQMKSPVLIDNDGISERVVIGPNGTSISRKDWNNINWKLAPAAITRKILMAVFDRNTLANNTLSGKPSPAFMDCNKPEKGKLNELMVKDIISFMTTHFEIKDRDVKCAITSKCADEAKSVRQRLSVGKRT